MDNEDAGNFTAYLEVTPDRQWLIAADSSGTTLRAFRVNGDGTLQPAVATGTSPTYVLDPGFSSAHGRLRLYGGGGISNSSNKIPAYDFNPSDGTFTPLTNAPFISPGNGPSPKLAVESSDGRFMIIGHGSSSEVRTFLIDPPTGDLTDTGFAFDVGIQGDLGDVEVLGELLLFTDKFSTPNTGLYSFTINTNGSLTMNGTLVSSQGTTPTGIAAWNPPSGSCYANCDGSSGTPLLTANDFQCFIDKYAGNNTYANCDGSTGTPALTANDFQCFINKYAGGC